MKKVSKKTIKKEASINDLAVSIKKLSISIEDLAMLTANGFSSLEERMSSRFQKAEDELKAKASRVDVLGLHDNFIGRHEFDRLSLRVVKLEEKAKK